MLAHVPSFGRNPRGSPDFLAYPVPKACMHVLGTRVPRRLGVARSASSPKAAQALGCSLTPGVRISFGRVTCMARAASVPRLWALDFLLLCGVCVLVWFAVGCWFCEPRQSWLGSWVGVFGHGWWCCPSSVGCLWCSWLGFGFGLLMGRVWLPRLPPAVSGSGVRCGCVCWARVLAVPSPSWLGCRGVFFALFFFFFAGCPCPGPCGPCPPIPFLLGWVAGSFFFSWCVSACFGVPFPGGPLFLAWCCRFWLGGPPVPLWGSCLRCLLGGVWPPLVVLAGGLVAVGCFRPPPPLPPLLFCFLLFFLGGGLPVPPSAFPGLAHALARIQCCLPSCCCQLRSLWPCSGPMGRLGYVHGGLGAPSCRVRSWLCRLGGCARRLLVALV